MRFFYFLFSLALFFVPFSPAFSQFIQVTQSDSIILVEQSEALDVLFSYRKERALQYAGENNLFVKKTLLNGRVMELQYISSDGLPVYYQTLNAGAANTTSASSLYPGGSLRLFITGKGFNAGVWDSGRIDYEHVEFGDRVRIMDNASNNTQHATHVAGTIIAAGIQPSARGMAFEAGVLGYDWNNDASEMASAAASGLLISNHSYGVVLGWSWEDGSWRWRGHADSLRDYRFGFYSGTSRVLDQIAFNAPYYTIVWAAGNDRNDAGDGSRPPDGPYDCIGPEGVAKNVLAIGAIHKISGGYTKPSDIVMTDFSSWGPTDDGRVKPDFVAAGASLYSSTPGNNYASFSGTSMAAPNASGSLLLLQQLFASQNQGKLMKAATLKSLAIHTVNQAGNSPGPDYRHGWGLLNVEKAARLINHRNQVDFFISENSLFQGEVFEMQFQADGTGNIIATIAWTDPAGSPVQPSMDPRDLMLVNDLDMRIFYEDGSEFFPWLLDPENPAMLPAQSDNFRDNVEKILIENPQPGLYTLRISHKGTLQNGKQDYSLCLQTKEIPKWNTYYWVGNSGTWSSAANWSLTSGGAPAGTVPGIEDHVVFDNNSFTGSETFSIVFESDAACHSFNWETEARVVMSLNNHILQINSSLYHTYPDLISDTPGTIVFTSRNKNNIVFLPEGFGEEITFRFENEKGSWRFLSDINVHAIEILGGEVDLKVKHIQISRFIVEGDLKKTVYLNNAFLEGLSYVDFDNAQLTINLEGTSFSFDNSDIESPKYLKGGGRAFKLVENVGGKLTIEGQNSFTQLKNDSHLEIMDAQLITKLQLQPGAVLTLKGGVIQEIIESFEAVGTENERITIMSDGSEPAWIHSDYNVKFCNDYLNVVNVSVSGLAVFGAGLNSIIEGNSIGWIQLECDDILFADFFAEFTCVNSLVFFHDLSSAMVTEWLWNFNLDDPLEPTSVKSDPYYIYTQTGTYNVSLWVSDGVYSHTGIKPVIIKENPFNVPIINVQGNNYTSSLSAPNYQWYLNGEPIQGATARTYTNANETPGQYQVLIFNQSCNRISQPYNFNVTNIESNELIEFNIYPNPAKDFFFISAPSFGLSEISLEIFDVHGTILHREKVYGNELLQKRISTESFLPGIYFLRLSEKGMSVIKKVLIL